jgi:hypothetical protein
MMPPCDPACSVIAPVGLGTTFKVKATVDCWDWEAAAVTPEPSTVGSHGLQSVSLVLGRSRSRPVTKHLMKGARKTYKDTDNFLVTK